jgi:predicted phage terminase large subunit-like protein
LLIDALRQIENQHYRAILFRRTYKQLEQAGGLIDRSHQLYPAMGGKYKSGSYSWVFPSSAEIKFAHLNLEENRYDHDGAMYSFIAFDELRHFTESMFMYLFSRARTTEETGLRVYVRAGTNPGGNRAVWIKKFWAPWIDKTYDKPANPGELVWFDRQGEDFKIVEPEQLHNHPNAKSRTFIPARIADNPYLRGTEYEANLDLLPRVERLRLKEGDWDITEVSGEVLNSAWFGTVDGIPIDVNRVRFWDLAATEKTTRGDDPDWTVGVLLARDRQGRYYIEDIQRLRMGWGTVRQTIKHIAQRDGREVMVGIELQPGAAGKAVQYEMTKYLAGYPVRWLPAVRDKVTRATVWAGPAELGDVHVKRADWNGALFDECDMFPDGDHDDIVDAVSGAFALLEGGSGIYV